MKRVFLAVTLMVFGAGLAAQEPASDRPLDPTSVTTTVGTGGQQPPPSAAQEGFVPIDQLGKKEELPAAPLVMSAYAVAWVAFFVYVWSIWQRLGKAEREIADLNRRLAAGGRR